MLVYDLVESTVLDRLYDVIIVCDVDDLWLVEVVPFHLGRWGRPCSARGPVVVVPFDVLPQVVRVVTV